MSVSDETWAEIRRAYLACDETIAQIAERTKVSVSEIQRRVRKEDWPRRSKSRRAGKKPSSGKVRGADKRPTRAKRRGGSSTKPGSVVRRLFRAIDLKLKRLEERMQLNDELSAADSEREARELSSMIRSFEKVTEVAADIDQRRRPAAGEKKPVRPEDAERMRREIAERLERLERLHATGLPDTDPEATG